MKLFSCTIVIFCALLFSCKKETETVTFNYEYNLLPLEIGNYIIYKGDSIIYNYFFAQVKRSSSFYLKETIKDTSRDNLNRLRYEISVQMRYDTTQNWGVEKIHYIVPTKTTIERVEDNLRYIKLIFPNQLGTQWNPNKYITQKIPYIFTLDTSLNIINSKAIVTSKDVNYSNSFKSFDSTLTTTNLIDSSAINLYKLTERYAKNIGLVYLERWNVIAKDPNTDQSLPWIDKGRLGFYLKLEAMQYGKE
ncbi:MAG: hypothetical protein IPK18_12305 [Sphingobacteriales bacterium]|jgi:hypothetical protein|nr:MAG: hypothetical protein IPK18_12305 [Sphingobacteriales bacterium]